MKFLDPLLVLRCALIVDAAQSIQANDLKFIPSFRKRLGNYSGFESRFAKRNPEEVSDDIIDLLGCDDLEDIIHVWKTGFGVENILAAIIEKIPAPKVMLTSLYKL
jgi:GTP-binding protein LepA